MSKIRIKNFGPIKEGFKETLPDGTVNEWMDVKKVTVFIGNQGSGKSTVAKLISTMTWIEKALVRGDFKEKEITTYNRFKKHCEFQNLRSYFKEDSIIEYQGERYYIKYENDNVTIDDNKNNAYIFPKITYVPAERNFITVVGKPGAVKRLPNTLYSFLDEFETARAEIKGGIQLPINNTSYEFHKLNSTDYIVGTDYKMRLTEASSGFQSIVPLYLVSQYWADFINQEKDESIKEISVEEEKRIRKEIESILSNSKLSEDVKKAALEFLSSRFRYKCFINIVEEPEQNLYPTSQRILLNRLLEFNNKNEGNKLIMTTHSPYLINYLTHAVKASMLIKKIEASNKNVELLNKLNEVVPIESVVGAEDWVVYELNETDGSIIKLPDYNYLPSDENYLNNSLGEANDIFIKLLELEDLCQ